MKYEKTVPVDATPSEIWELVADIESVAGCIPGLEGFQKRSPTEFDSVLVSRVGPVTSNFELNTRLHHIVPEVSLTATSEGEDPDLDSWVRAEQRFDLATTDSGTVITITADVSITGRIATYGQRIIASKAEQVVLQTVSNVSELLKERRSRSA